MPHPIVERRTPASRSVRSGERISREERTRREEALTRAPLFRAMSKRHVREFAIVGKVREYPDGECVVEEGKSGSSLFVILDGDALVLAGGKRIASTSAGDFFGEISLLASGPRTATVKADGALRCLELPGTEFRRVLREDPGLAMTVAEELAARLRNLAGYRPSRAERLFLYS